MIGFITHAVAQANHKARANHDQGRGSETLCSWVRSGIKVADSRASGLTAVFGRRRIDRPVSTQHESGTTEANRIICNCVACGRIRSIERGRGGECAECWGGERWD